MADDYVCQLCGRRWVVPSLARCCEGKCAATYQLGHSTL